MNTASRIAICISIAIIATIGAYAGWYSYHRHEVMTQANRCDRQLSHPEEAPKTRAPDGTYVQILTPCRMDPIPPSFFDLIRGKVVLTGVPERMQVNPYTFWDVLLAHYTVGPAPVPACDQSATTTNCAALIERLAEQRQPQGPRQQVAATTTKTISNFTLSYPTKQGRLSEFGWEGVVSPGNYTLVLNGITNYNLYIFTTPSPLSSINPTATSLDDYRTDYPISTSTPEQMAGPEGTTITIPKTEVHILSSQDATINGIPMLRQRYSVGYWSTNPNGQRTFKTDSDGGVTNELRYVFYDGKTFVVLTGWQADHWIDYIAHTIHLK